jgi:hypothetical protein
VEVFKTYSLQLGAQVKAEIRRIMVPGQPGQKVSETLSPQKQFGHGACTCHSSDGRKLKNCSPGQSGQKVRPYLQNKTNKKSWRCGSSGRMPAWQV